MITKQPFGKTRSGEKVNEYVLDNGEFRVHILDYGATVTKMFLKDKNGVERDVVLGYDDLSSYEDNAGYLGAFIGRVCNRIADSRFTINDVECNVVANTGKVCLHGGKKGFDKTVFSASIDGDKLTLRAVSPDGDQGFPGRLEYKVVYSLDGCGLDIYYEAVSDKDTCVNFTNHSYFNLSNEQTILNHILTIDSDYITALDKDLVATGEFIAVNDGPFDFKKGHKVGLYIDYPHQQLKYGGGYDCNYVLKNYGKYEKVASVFAEDTGIEMSVYTDNFGIQLYTGNCLANERGKNGRIHVKNAAICLETQNFPNAINQPSFPNSVLKAGELYHTRSTYKFTVKK